MADFKVVLAGGKQAGRQQCSVEIFPMKVFLVVVAEMLKLFIFKSVKIIQIFLFR